MNENFAPPPDPRAFVASEAQRRALACLGAALAHGNGLVLVTGPAGSGKSALAAHLVATVDAERVTAVTIAAGDLAGRPLARAVAEALGLVVGAEGPCAALAACERFLHAEACAGRRCLLAIDDAHALPVGELDTLVALADARLGAHPLLQVVLLARSEFRTRVETAAMAPLRRRVAAAHDLGGPDAGEGPAEVPGPAPDGVGTPPEADGGKGERLLAQRDACIAELRQAAVERCEGSATERAARESRSEVLAAALAEASERIVLLEARALEQERTLRQVVTTLIEWIEGDEARRTPA